MNRTIYLSTVIRGAPLEEGGSIYKINWDSKEVLHERSIVPPAPQIVDPNPRGNTRGGRGILLDDHGVHVATYHSILSFDHDLNPLGVRSGNLCVGLHEMSFAGQSMLASATAIDGFVEMKADGSQGEFWHVSESKALSALLDIPHQEYDPGTDHRLKFLGAQHLKSSNHTHLNAVTMFKGERWVLLNRYGIVFNVDRDAVVVHDESIRGCHNLIIRDDSILVNDTLGKKVMIYGHDGELKEAIDLLAYDKIKRLYRQVSPQRAMMVYNYFFQKQRLARPFFVRGMAVSEDGQLFISFSPATIVQFDLETRTFVDMMNLSRDLVCAPHGLTLGSL